MKRLSEEEIQSSLSEVGVEWAVVAGVSLVRVFEFDDFKSALKFTNQVGELAEKASHHPDIQLSWGKVEVSLTTHSENGLTDADFKLAKQIDSV